MNVFLRQTRHIINCSLYNQSVTIISNIVTIRPVVISNMSLKLVQCHEGKLFNIAGNAGGLMQANGSSWCSWIAGGKDTDNPQGMRLESR